MKRTSLALPLALVAIVALVVAGGATAKKPALSATPVFKLNLIRAVRCGRRCATR